LHLKFFENGVTLCNWKKLLLVSQTLETIRFDDRDDPGRHGRRCTNPQPTRESGL